MLSQKHRRTIHEKLAPIVGDEEVDAMLSEFPASPSDAPLTKSHFERRLDERFVHVDERFAQMDVRFAQLEGSLRAEMHNLGRQMVMWSTGSVIAGMGLAATIGALFGG